MDSKRVNGPPEHPAVVRSARRWVAAIALFTLLPMAAGWVLGPGLWAQDKKGSDAGSLGTVTIPSAPVAPSAENSPSNQGKVGFVTVDPYDFPAAKLADTVKKPAESSSVVQTKPEAAPVPPSAPLPPLPKIDLPTVKPMNPFPPLMQEHVPVHSGFAAPESPAALKNQLIAPVFTPAVENSKMVFDLLKNEASVHPQFQVGPKPAPQRDENVKQVQHFDILTDKAVQPATMVSAPPLQLLPAQKEQPAPVPLPLPLPQIVPPPAGERPGVLPQPRPLPMPPFGADQIRMPLMGDTDVTIPLGMTPHPTAKDLAEQAKYVKGFIDPANTIDLIQNRARLMMMKETPKRIQVSDEAIAVYTVIDNKEITILGKTPGTTVLNMWFTDKDDKTKETVLSYLVRVFPDPDQKNRLERVFRALEIEINKHFPDSLVRLTLVGDKVMVTGQAHDIFEATQILKVVVANAPGSTKIPSEGLANTPRPEHPNNPNAATPGQDNYISSGSPSVINMLRIGGVHQVMLRVVVAEVNRSAARTIGLNFSLTNSKGTQYLANLTGGIATAAAQSVSQLGAVTPVGNLPINLDNGQVSLSVNALKRMNYAKSLAEPNLVTMNGQPAFFLAGGQFPVPVVAGNAVGGLQGTTFVPFGVQLQFTPFITDKDRIRLSVNATVSTRDTSTGTNIGNSAVPGLTSRNFSSTVEMRDGQTLAVAGLIQTNSGADRDQLPFLGEIPFLNRFTGFDRTSAAEQELIVLVTPELVQPMYHQQVPRLPGSDLFEPSDLEFYLLGRLEGRRLTDFRSPVMTDIHRIRQYNRVEQHYIFGPAGFYNIPLIPK